jgi:hypothetical protein
MFPTFQFIVFTQAWRKCFKDRLRCIGKNFGFEIYAEKFGKEELEKRLKDELTVSDQHVCTQNSKAKNLGKFWA